jgi:hypothetical protein
MRITRVSIIISAAAFGLALAAIPQQAAAHDEPVVGSLFGAGIGAAIGGPPGAAVGAIIGGAIGSHVAHETDHGAHAHPHRRARVEHRHYGERVEHRHYRERVAYVPAIRANGNGSTHVHCPPEKKAYYKPKVVHRDDRTRVAYQPTPKMKKVCRYVPVKRVNAAAEYRSAG